jgi:predicted phage terminase large subunit-like protein
LVEFTERLGYVNADFHKQIYAALEDMKIKRLLIILPPGHGKSTCVTVNYPLWRVGNDHNYRCIAASYAKDFVASFLREITGRMQSPEYIQDCKFGELKPQRGGAQVGYKWASNEIIVQRPIIHKDPTFTALGTGQGTIGRRAHDLIADDIVDEDHAYSETLRERLWSWWKNEFLTRLEPNGRVIVVGCLPGRAKVLMADGNWKCIRDVQQGELVWSRDGDTLHQAKVLAQIPQGESQTIEVQTARHSLRATPNHPFLMLENGGAVWKKAEQLRIGDKIVTLSQVPRETSKRDINGRFLRREQFWLLGFLFGDGWIHHSPGRIQGFDVAKSAYPELNQRVCSTIEHWFDKRPVESKHGYYVVSSSRAARILINLGFDGSAKTKRIPKWIFTTRTSYRRAFLQGLVDSDGHKFLRGYGYRIELSNKDLIEDVYWLALTSGVRPGKILHRARLIRAPHSHKEQLSETWSIALTFIKRQRYGCGMMAWERVEAVLPGITEPVYDLTIEGTSSFIANGYVVHNTRVHFLDLYGRLLKEKDENDNPLWHTIILPAYDKQLAPLWEAKWPLATLLGIKRELGSPVFTAKYLGDPTPQEGATLKREWLNYWSDEAEDKSKRVYKLPVRDKLRIYQAWDLAISEDPSADWTVGLTLGVDMEGGIYLLHYERDHWDFPTQVKQVQVQAQIWNPLKIAIESNAYQKALPQALRAGLLPIVEVKQTRDKIMRIQELAPHFENGAIRISRSHDEFLLEYLQFPKGEHDDILDALHLAFSQVKVPAADLSRLGSWKIGD